MLSFLSLSLIIPLIAGILAGYFLRGRRRANFGKASLSAILLLIFSLGFNIGSNSELLNSMPRIGLTALVMSVSAIAFSILLVLLATRRLKMR